MMSSLRVPIDTIYSKLTTIAQAATDTAAWPRHTDVEFKCDKLRFT